MSESWQFCGLGRLQLALCIAPCCRLLIAVEGDVFGCVRKWLATAEPSPHTQKKPLMTQILWMPLLAWDSILLSVVHHSVACLLHVQGLILASLAGGWPLVSLPHAQQEALVPLALWTRQGGRCSVVHAYVFMQWFLEAIYCARAAGPVDVSRWAYVTLMKRHYPRCNQRQSKAF
eukprot:1156375-Pelagomonas_calceolata.AAC.3